MKKIIKVKPFEGRFLVLEFEGETEPRVFDTLLIREGVLEQLNNRAFFDGVFINSITKSVVWEGELDLDPDVLFIHSVSFSALFTSYFDVEGKEEAMDVVHDGYLYATGDKPNELTVHRLITELPKDIISLGERWGWYDTEVREKIYTWAEETLKTKNKEVC